MLIPILFAFPFIFAVALLAFIPRKSTIVGNELRVRTLAVTLKYDLTEIRGAMAVSPEDIHFGKTIRLLGAGWPFKPYGYFSNAKLGRFLAFVTDWQKMVLVIFPDKRLLVSPDNPKINSGPLHRLEFCRSLSC
jgi:PH (Pleckstrin Homology) domain-containing protein